MCALVGLFASGLLTLGELVPHALAIENKSRPRHEAANNFATMLDMRLGTLLLRDAIITLTQLEQSLRAQVLSGGLLGTNLVELGFIDLNTLGRYLARILDTPLAIADHLEKAEPKLLEAFGAQMADHHSALPLRFEDDEANTIAVVMRNPKNSEEIAAISKHMKLKVRAYVAPELRIFYYLERYYGIRRRTRFTRAPQAAGKKPKSRRERRATQPCAGSDESKIGARQQPSDRRPDHDLENQRLVGNSTGSKQPHEQACSRSNPNRRKVYRIGLV